MFVSADGPVRETQSDSQATQAAADLSTDPSIKAGQDPILGLHNCHLAAEFREGTAQLNPDVTAAHQDQVFGEMVGEEQFVGADDPVAVRRQVV